MTLADARIIPEEKRDQAAAPSGIDDLARVEDEVGVEGSLYTPYQLYLGLVQEHPEVVLPLKSHTVLS